MGDVSNAWTWDPTAGKYHKQEFRNGHLVSVWRATLPYTPRSWEDASQYGGSYSAPYGHGEEYEHATGHYPSYPYTVQHPGQHPSTYDSNQAYSGQRDTSQADSGQPLQQQSHPPASEPDQNWNRQIHAYNTAYQNPRSLCQDAYVLPTSPPNTQSWQVQRAGTPHPAGAGVPSTTQNNRVMLNDQSQLSVIREDITFIPGNLDAVQAEGLPETGRERGGSRSTKLDKEYQIRHRDFFHLGRVFATLFTEPCNKETTEKDLTGRNVSDVMLGEKAFTHIRRFVVIEGRRGFCYGFPIATYGSRATTKPGVDSNCHSIIYTTDQAPSAVYGEEHMLEPIRVITGALALSLDSKSRLNLGMRVAVQHNVKVKNCGVIDPSHLPRFYIYGKMEATNSFPQDPSKAYAAQVQHPSVQPYIPGVRVSNQWSTQDASWHTYTAAPIVHSQPTQWQTRTESDSHTQPLARVQPHSYNSNQQDMRSYASTSKRVDKSYHTEPLKRIEHSGETSNQNLEYGSGHAGDYDEQRRRSESWSSEMRDENRRREAYASGGKGKQRAIDEGFHETETDSYDDTYAQTDRSSSYKNMPIRDKASDDDYANSSYRKSSNKPRDTKDPRDSRKQKDSRNNKR